MNELMIGLLIGIVMGYFLGVASCKGLLYAAREKLREARADKEMALGFHEASREFANSVKALTKVMEARVNE